MTYTRVEPENVDIGDVIEVVLPTHLGVTVKRRGVVGHRESYSNAMRILYTPEGGELYTWFPKIRTGAVFLIARAEQPAETLFNIEPSERLNNDSPVQT